MDAAYERSYRPDDYTETSFPARDTGWIDRSYPSTASLEEADLLTADEAKKQETSYLGKPGVPADDLNDDVPDFLHTAAKAGPPLDHLGRTKNERKLKPLDAAALGEKNALVVVEDPVTRVVTVLRDHDLDYPDLYLAVYVAGDWAVDDDEAKFARLFARSGCYRADSVETADLVVFGGGTDVEPALYGEKNEDAHHTVYFNRDRDSADMDIYIRARNEGVAMMGVCRGAQFLHVMNGGKLFQDIDGHQGSHKAFAIGEQTLIENVTSVHHQSCRMNTEGGMEILLTTAKSQVKSINKNEKLTKASMDIEGFFYRDTGCFGVQGHPEYSGANKFSIWCLEQINNLFLCSPDFEWSGKRLRMTKEARDDAFMTYSIQEKAKEAAKNYIENAYAKSKEV